MRSPYIKATAAVERLFQLIEQYESDTFRASGSEINLSEIDEVAVKLIDGIEEHLDGVRLSAILNEIRE